jgi:integrase
MTFILNDMLVKNLKPETKEYSRREKGGFGVRVMPTGRKVFFYLYRVDGNRRFLNLGTYKTKEFPEGVTLAKAREEYEAERAKVKALKAGRAEGADPVEERREKKSQREEKRKAQTVCALVEEYIDRHAKRFKRSWQADERLLNKEVVPVWGKRKAADITKRDVTLLLESIIDRGAPAMSNQVLKITRKVFNFGIERDILQHTPFTGVKALAPNNSRERALTEVEIRTLWGTLDKAAMSNEIRQALKLILLTAQRPGEVTGMHSGEIDDRWWTIPAERAKNGRTHRVYLTDTALELVGPLEVTDPKTGETKAKGYIFPCPHKDKEKPIEAHALAVAVRRNLSFPVTDSKGKPLYDKNGTPATENRLGIEHFTPHDLRRTAATFMAQAGEMDEVIDAVLNHAKQGVIKVYNQYRYDLEKQQALETWERKLQSIVSGSAADNVVPMRRKGKK